MYHYEDLEDYCAWQRGPVVWSDRQLGFADYWLIVWRHRWLLIMPFVIISIGAVVYSRTLPDIYRASTSVLVEAPKVPEAYVQSTVSTRVQERLRTITQQITSRTRLELVARELQLISDSLETILRAEFRLPHRQ